MNGEPLFARTWNRFVARQNRPLASGGLNLGLRVLHGQVAQTRVAIPLKRRFEHIAILGKTGTGKSSLLRHLAAQDIQHDRGFVFVDIHGDTAPYLLRRIAEEEQKRGQDLSRKVIVIEPADQDWSVGMNVLAQQSAQQTFVQVAEVTQILKDRWHLDTLGPRTEELLRNALYVLSQNNLTLVELAPLLTTVSFRTSCLKKVSNPEVKAYFKSRFDRLSDAMQRVFVEALLNKSSVFAADPHFRHIVGQQSTISLVEAIDQGRWVLLNLDKGRLGEQAVTLGSLFLTKLKNALFARRKRSPVSVYADEIQNLMSLDGGLDTLLSESRKFGAAICSANQFLEQLPLAMRSGLLALGTLVSFQLSASDADRLTAALSGGRTLKELLKNLSHRQMIVKSGDQPWCQAQVPELRQPTRDYQDLYQRCRRRWARPRSEIEEAIQKRHAAFTADSHQSLDEWE